MKLSFQAFEDYQCWSTIGIFSIEQPVGQHDHNHYLKSTHNMSFVVGNTLNATVFYPNMWVKSALAGVK